MKTSLSEERQRAFDKFVEESGQAAAVVAFYGELGPEHLGMMMETPWTVLDVYEEAPASSACERDAAAALRNATLKGDQIVELWSHTDTTKGFALVTELSLHGSFGITSNWLREGLGRLRSFLDTVTGYPAAADAAMEKLAFNAGTVPDLVEVLKITSTVPLSVSHGLMKQKLRQHTWDELFTQGIMKVVATSYPRGAMDELILAAAHVATTRQQALALVAMTEQKSETRSLVLAKADSLPNAQPAA